MRSSGVMSADDDLGEVRERREALYEAAAMLEGALAAPASTARWRDDLGDALSTLCSTLAEHVSGSEAPDGVLSTVRQDCPRLSNQIDRMIAEHATLTAAAEQLIDRLEHAPAERSQIETDALRDEALDLLGVIARHRQRGSDLIYEAYNVDVGGPG